MDWRVPKPDWLIDDEWDWPWRKFNLDPEDLFTTIHERFNLMPMPIQDVSSFHHDVISCVTYSNTLEEFYSQLEARKEQRVKEVREAWRDIYYTMIGCSTLLGCPKCHAGDSDGPSRDPNSEDDNLMDRRGAFHDLSCRFSCYTLIRFFDGYARDARKRLNERRRQRDKRMQEALNKRMTNGSRRLEAAGPDSAQQISPQTASDETDTPAAEDDGLGVKSSSHSSTLATPPSPAPPTKTSELPDTELPTAASTPLPPSRRKRKSDEDAEDGHEDASRLSKKQRRSVDSKELNTETLAYECASQVRKGWTVKPSRPEKRKRTDDDAEQTGPESRTKRTRIDNDEQTDSETRMKGAKTDDAELTHSEPRTKRARIDDAEQIDSEPRTKRAKIDNDALNSDDAISLQDLHLQQAAHDADTYESTPANAARLETRGPQSRAPQKQTRAQARKKKQQQPRKQAEEEPNEEKKEKDGRGQARRRKSSPAERLRSTRSSRRNPPQQPWCLGDDAKACPAR